MVNMKKFKSEHRDFCNRYNQVLDLYYRASRYLESHERSDLEIEKYLPTLEGYTKELSKLMYEFTNITGENMEKENILYGFILYN